MDVLMLTKHDWANTGWRFYKSLKLLGLNVEFFKGQAHGLKYPEQAKVHPAIAQRTPGPQWILKVPELKELIEKAHVVHFIASTFIDTGANLQNKHVVVQHGGSQFRQSSAKLNKLFNEITDHTVIQCPDLLGLGAKNETLIYYPVDTNLLQPDYEQKHKLITIGHFPRSPKIKGTGNILVAIHNAANKRFRYIGIKEVGPKNPLPWMEHLKRIKKCDIIIETCNLKLGKARYGEWANTALEAAALGKIVISNTLSKDIYNHEYGELGIHIANNVPSLINRIKQLTSLDKNQLIEEKKKSREWAVKHHSLEATALRLWDKVYCNFFAEQKNKLHNIKK